MKPPKDASTAANTKKTGIILKNFSAPGTWKTIKKLNIKETIVSAQKAEPMVEATVGHLFKTRKKTSNTAQPPDIIRILGRKPGGPNAGMGRNKREDTKPNIIAAPASSIILIKRISKSSVKKGIITVPIAMPSSITIGIEMDK